MRAALMEQYGTAPPGTRRGSPKQCVSWSTAPKPPRRLLLGDGELRRGLRGLSPADGRVGCWDGSAGWPADAVGGHAHPGAVAGGARGDVNTRRLGRPRARPGRLGTRRGHVGGRAAGEVLCGAMVLASGCRLGLAASAPAWGCRLGLPPRAAASSLPASDAPRPRKRVTNRRTGGSRPGARLAGSSWPRGVGAPRRRRPGRVDLVALGSVADGLRLARVDVSPVGRHRRPLCRRARRAESDRRGDPVDPVLEGGASTSPPGGTRRRAPCSTNRAPTR